MRESRRSRAAWGILVAVAVGMPRAAHADADDRSEKKACIAASEDAQQLKLDGKLTQARQRLFACARAECPAVVRQDCAQWIAQVNAELPTVVLGARDAEGRDLIEARVLE